MGPSTTPPTIDWPGTPHRSSRAGPTAQHALLRIGHQPIEEEVRAAAAGGQIVRDHLTAADPGSSRPPPGPVRPGCWWSAGEHVPSSWSPPRVRRRASRPRRRLPSSRPTSGRRSSRSASPCASGSWFRSHLPPDHRLGRRVRDDRAGLGRRAPGDLRPGRCTVAAGGVGRRARPARPLAGARDPWSATTGCRRGCPASTTCRASPCTGAGLTLQWTNSESLLSGIVEMAAKISIAVAVVAVWEMATLEAGLGAIADGDGGGAGHARRHGDGRPGTDVSRSTRSRRGPPRTPASWWRHARGSARARCVTTTAAARTRHRRAQ